MEKNKKVWRVGVLGAGCIGQFIANWLSQKSRYCVYLIDQRLPKEGGRLSGIPSRVQTVSTQIETVEGLQTALGDCQLDAVICALPYYLSIVVAQWAKIQEIHYFDLTEDVRATDAIRSLAQGARTVFMSQCGLAPGIVSVIAKSLMSAYTCVDTVKIRVGALPQASSHPLQYALTWSTDGLVNEYNHPCAVITEGQLMQVPALQGLETLTLLGNQYEAFYTSGGIGSLVRNYQSKVRHMDYKSIRYPGHCEKMRFLMQDMGLGQHPDQLKQLLEAQLPRTRQDRVLIYVSVSGEPYDAVPSVAQSSHAYTATHYFKVISPKTVDGLSGCAIQWATAADICAAVDIILPKTPQYAGFICQEDMDFSEVIHNEFGVHYAEDCID